MIVVLGHAKKLALGTTRVLLRVIGTQIAAQSKAGDGGQLSSIREVKTARDAATYLKTRIASGSAANVRDSEPPKR